MKSIEFKGSMAFVKILDRLLIHYERHMIPFEDVYFCGRIIETRQQIKNIFQSDKIKTPMAKRLKRIENIIMEKIYPMQKNQLDTIQKIVHKKGGHEFEVKSFSRLLSLKKTKAFSKRLKRFTQVDYLNLYKTLFSGLSLFKKLAKGFDIPEHIEDIFMETRENLENGFVTFEDCAPLLYLKLKIEGNEFFNEIRQIVIDEAQDYYPMQYEVFKLLFKDAGYTVLGDFNQAIEKDVSYSLYDEIIEILNGKVWLKLTLNKSYRASYEINTFTRNLLGGIKDFISFERHEAEPVVMPFNDRDSKDSALVNEIKKYFEEGYESAAIICKTQQEAEDVFKRLNGRLDISLISPQDSEVQKGATIIPSYIAKGLEFDVVIIYDAGSQYYSHEHDKKLLYVACTRALHRLVIYYSGEISRFLKKRS
jgi:DNA helicase-2/ATP-dependent DNA helicase PcrA